MGSSFLYGLVLGIALFGSALAEPADTILLNGKVVRYDHDAPSEAIAIRDGRIIAIGSSTDLRNWAGNTTRVIDVGGRTIIPGLIDSHIHAIRAGLTWNTEVHWIGVPTLQEALSRLRRAAQRTPKGSWLIVAGGWTEQQFAEGRRPTQNEIEAAAPDHHVYVQLLYSRVLLDRGGLEALTGKTVAPDGLAIERDGSGVVTGWLTGDNRSISNLFENLPKPSFEQKVESTRAFFRELNRMGLTGVLDPGGYNLSVWDYEALHKIWSDRDLTLRVVYSISAPRKGTELGDFQGLTQIIPMGFGDEWLRFNGIGENVTWGMYNNDRPTDEQKRQLYEVLRWAVSRRITATFHWHNDRSVHHLLDVLERINAETPIADLRWSIAHLNDASVENLQRMKRLGVGWLVQNAFYFRGEAFLAQRGTEFTRSVPPLRTALRLGVHVGGGTDAHRVMNYNPFVSLQWMLDSKTISGVKMRAPNELPTRLEALRIYTEGSAWFAFDENRRGRLDVGYSADLAVLNADYLTIEVEKISAISSVLTMVNGKIVHQTLP